MSEHMSLEEYRRITSQDAPQSPQTRSKYGNVKTVIDGITFDSKAEARRYGELVLLQKSGLIRGFARQPSFLFSSGVRYRPDFIVSNCDGTIFVEDVKGTCTKEFLLKQKIWKSEYPWIELRIIK